MTRLLGAAFAVIMSIAFVGCGPPSIPTVSYSPESMASEAMRMYDTNKDNKLDATELKKCPSLGNSLAEIDKNGDKCLDAEEIAARIATYTTSGTRLRGERARVIRGKRPVVGATVTLEPEKFMGSSIKPATGVSDESGDVVFKSEGQPFEGVQVGFYTVIVSQKDPSGKELVPAKFNNPTTLGVEVAPSNRVSLVFDLDK